MRPDSIPRHSLAAALLFLLLPAFASAQVNTAGQGGAPPSIQFFMPNGTMPEREVRFTLMSDSGRIEVYFSDSKGRFIMSPVLGLKSSAEYRIVVQSDGTSYDTTMVTFKEFGVYQVQVFLRPLRAPATKPARVVDIAELDSPAPETARQAYAEAMRAYKAGQNEEAVRGLKQAIELYPDYFRALNDLGVIYMKMGKLDLAAQMFEQAIKIGPRVYYPRLNLAKIYTRQGKYKEAVLMLEQLHKENSALAEVRIALGDALMAMNRLEEAEPHLRAALADPKLERESAGDVHYKLGSLLSRKEQYDEAIKELSQAVEVLPDSARSHLQLGGALLQVNRMGEAERELLAAYRIGGAQMGGAQLMLGQIYFMRQNFESALRAFEQYLADVPKAPNAAQVEGVVKKIKVALNKE
ncbi:MAG TPA: tetratricopeptide repeat protein [Blastocatellia bacterium]|nr:tetratricopeptide repeat protein [Blastocatellia bacterium]